MRLLRWRTVGLLIALTATVLAVGAARRRYTARRLGHALAAAVDRQDGYQQIASLLEAGADPVTPLSTGCPILVRAAQHPDPRVAQLLLRAGTPLSGEFENQTPLTEAIRHQHRELARELLDRGAVINPERPEISPLLAAIQAADVESAALLLKRGASVHWPYPLHRAAEFGGVEMLRLLLRSGGNVNAADLLGTTPLMNAADPAVARALISAGAQVNARDQRQRTALHHAARRADEPLVRTLLAAGADAQARDRNGRTPLHEALEHLYGAVGPTTGVELTSAGKRQVRQNLALYAEAGVPAARIARLLQRRGARQ